MMQQSNALRRLEEILTEAIEKGEVDKASGPVLLKAMGLEKRAQNIVGFYNLLDKAKEETRSIKKPKINRYIQTVEELNELFIVNHVWTVKWSVFASHINSKDILNTLDSLADFFNSQRPLVLLEKDFLENLNDEFTSLLNMIPGSDLSKEMKIFLIDHIENILRAIRRYYIDGTEGLKQSAQSLIGNLVVTEHRFKDEDKKNPAYNSVKSWIATLVLCFAHSKTPSPYDMIGIVPDINDFWIPTFKELILEQEKVEKIICETGNLQEALEKASSLFYKKELRSLTGQKEPLALPASKEIDAEE